MCKLYTRNKKEVKSTYIAEKETQIDAIHLRFTL